MGRQRIPLGGLRLAVPRLFAAIFLALILLGVSGAHADAADKVLLLDTTLSGGTSSPEAEAVTDAGFEPVVVDSTTWEGMTAAQFRSYRAIVLGDDDCDYGNANAAVANANVWGPELNGNVMIVGTDPVYHQYAGEPGANKLTTAAIRYATSQAGKTGAYISLSCYYHETAEHTPVPLLEGLSEAGGFTVRGVGCYNDAHIVAQDASLSGITDEDLSGWSCSVHEAFDSYPSDFVVLGMARDIGSTYTAPDGTVGTPYILARGAGTSYTGRRYVALGDSVAAGEGIGYGWTWNGKEWTGGSTTGNWDTTFRPAACHQTQQGYPWVVKNELSAGLKDFACTGASAIEGVLGIQPDHALNVPQLGWTGAPGLLGSAAANFDYDHTDGALDPPDVVTLTVGADDVDFSGILADCYTKFEGGCGHDNTKLDALLATQKQDLDKVLEEIDRRGTADGHKPLVVLTTYYNPMPLDTGCVDNSPFWPAYYLNAGDLNWLIGGLNKLNYNIADEAAAHHDLVLWTGSLFADHKWCSDDPWVYGASIKRTDTHSQAPFHPTPEGQQAIGDALAALIADKLPVSTGTSVHVTLPYGKLSFSSVGTSGEAAIIPASQLPGIVPPATSFLLQSAYDVQSSAAYSGDITVSLPSTSDLQMFHFVNGAWEVVPSTFDGSYVQGTVSSLSPFALGTAVSPVHAEIAPVSGGEAPATISFDGSASHVEDGSPIASYDWDFGDGQTGSGAKPHHTYSRSGTYTVKLTTTAADGAVDVATTTVEVTDQPPTAVLSGPTTATAGVPVSFDGAGSSDPNGTVTGMVWSFGDGDAENPTVGTRVTHTFKQPGTYTVTLAAFDNEEEAGTASKSLTVSAPPADAPSVPADTPQPPPAATLPAEHPLAGAAVHVIKVASVDQYGHVRIRVRCEKGGSACRGQLTLSRGRSHNLGTCSFSMATGEEKTLTIRLRGTARKWFARHKRLNAKVLVVLQGNDAKTVAVSIIRVDRRGA